MMGWGATGLARRAMGAKGGHNGAATDVARRPDRAKGIGCASLSGASRAELAGMAAAAWAGIAA